MKNLLRNNKGLAMLMVLALMGLSIPMITAALGLASTLANDSRVKNRIARAQYTDLGATEYTLYLIGPDGNGLDDPDTFPDENGDGDPDPFTIPINDEDVPVDVDPEDPTVNQPPSDATFRTTKTVTPTTANLNELTTFTYTITIENIGTETWQLKKVHDGLPSGFSYVAGSTGESGFDITTSDPVVVQHGTDDDDPNTYTELIWDVRPQEVFLDPGQFVTLSFDAQALLSQDGNYCNTAWTEPEGPNSRTAPTAKVTAGNPSSSDCIAQYVIVTKTVEVAPHPTDPDKYRATYTVTIENNGPDRFDIWWIRDKLPAQLEYVLGSTTGNLCSCNPFPRDVIEGRQRLNWFWLFPPKPLPSGETRTLVFQADGPENPGYFMNEIWVFFTQTQDQDARYSWPSAGVKVMNKYRVMVNNKKVAELEVLDNETIINKWYFNK